MEMIKDAEKIFTISYANNGVTQAIAVKAMNESDAKDKFLDYMGKKKIPVKFIGIREGADVKPGMPVIDSCEKRLGDATPVEVVRKVATVPSVVGNYDILEVKGMEGRKFFLIVLNYRGENPYYGGGTIEFSLDKAKKTAQNYATIEKLHKKYGEKEGYKRWMAGETDSGKKVAIVARNQDEFTAKRARLADANYLVSYLKEGREEGKCYVVAANEQHAAHKVRRYFANKDGISVTIISINSAEAADEVRNAITVKDANSVIQEYVKHDNDGTSLAQIVKSGNAYTFLSETPANDRDSFDLEELKSYAEKLGYKPLD
jgi:hypothetical protein